MWKRLSSYAPATSLTTCLAYVVVTLVRGKQPDLGTATATVLGTAGLMACLSLSIAALKAGSEAEESREIHEHLLNNKLYLIVGSVAGAWASAQALLNAFR